MKAQDTYKPKERCKQQKIERMKLALWLLFLCSHVIPHVQSSRRTWTVSVPSRIPVLKGYCVVIPCTYTYPRPPNKHSLYWWKGFWKKGNRTVSTNVPHVKLPKEYKQRTAFLGDMKARTCTMLLDGVRSSDTGPFIFSTEMSPRTRFSFTKNPVTIDVIQEPWPPSVSVQMREKITVSCSVTHSCPVMPPKLSWDHKGTITQRLKKLNEWKWETVSLLTFNPLFTDFNKTITCTVKYRGEKQAQSSTVIKI